MPSDNTTPPAKIPSIIAASLLVLLILVMAWVAKGQTTGAPITGAPIPNHLDANYPMPGQLSAQPIPLQPSPNQAEQNLLSAYTRFRDAANKWTSLHHPGLISPQEIGAARDMRRAWKALDRAMHDNGL